MRITEYNRRALASMSVNAPSGDIGVSSAVRSMAREAESISSRLKQEDMALTNVQANGYLQETYQKMAELRTVVQGQHADDPRNGSKVFYEQGAQLVNQTANNIADKGIRKAYVENANILLRRVQNEMIDWGEQKFKQNGAIALTKSATGAVKSAFSADEKDLQSALTSLEENLYSLELGGGLPIDPEERNKIFMTYAKQALDAHLSALMDLDPMQLVKNAEGEKYLEYKNTPAGVVRLTPEENADILDKAKKKALDFAEQKKTKDILDLAAIGSEAAAVVGNGTMTVSQLKQNEMQILLFKDLDEEAMKRFLDLNKRLQDAVITRNQKTVEADPAVESGWFARLANFGARVKYKKAGLVEKSGQVVAVKGEIKSEFGGTWFGKKRSSTLYELLTMMSDITDEYTRGVIGEAAYKSLNKILVPMIIAAERGGIKKSVPESYRTGLEQIKKRADNLPARYSSTQRAQILVDAYIEFSDYLYATQTNGGEITPGVVTQTVQAAWLNTMRKVDPSFIHYKKGDTFISPKGSSHRVESVDPITGDVFVSSENIINQDKSQ